MVYNFKEIQENARKVWKKKSKEIKKATICNQVRGVGF